MKKKLIIIILIILTLLIITGSLFIIKKENDTKKDLSERVAEEEKLEEETVAEEKDIDTSNWKTYRNEEYGFEVKYPEDWKIGEYKKNDYNSIVYITDSNSESIGKLNTPGDNLVIHFFQNINQEIHIKNSQIKINNLEDFFNLSFQETETCKLGEIELKHEHAHVVGLGGMSLDLGIFLEKEGGVYGLIFEKINAQGIDTYIQEICIDKKKSERQFNIYKYLTPEERKIVESFDFM